MDGCIVWVRPVFSRLDASSRLSVDDRNLTAAGFLTTIRIMFEPSAAPRSKRERRDRRERFIVERAIALFVDKGFLGVRMADVAAACGLSMGTIYSHFVAKEDLLMGCAAWLTRAEKVLYQGIIATRTPAMERIVTCFTVNWMIAQHHAGLVEIRHLSLMPSIWSRAHAQRISELNALHHEFFDMMQALVLEVIDRELDEFVGGSELSRDARASLINHGMWGLCVGLNSTAQSGIVRAENSRHEACSYQHFTANVIHFLKGYGWSEPAPQQVFEVCRKAALASLAGHAWFACPEPDPAANDAPHA